MTNKIEFINVNGKDFNVSIFPDSVKQMVHTYEMVREEYNKAAIKAAALNDYMNRVANEVESAASTALQELVAPQKPEAAPEAAPTINVNPEDVIPGDIVG